MDVEIIKTIRLKQAAYLRLAAEGGYEETMDRIVTRLLDEVDEARKARRATAGKN